jgi:UDP-2,3-diacylglucosamine pyrophosphatase LpxH
MVMEAICYDVVILSDLHLGSEISRARDALELLRSLRFRRLILLGDIFCDLNFRRLKREHWQFLAHIRKLSNPKRGVHVVWVEGNHDFGLTDVMSHLVGVPVYKEYIWESGGERHLAVHGHQFDNFVIKKYLWMTALAGNLYLFIQKLSSKGKFLAQFLDRLNTQWQRLTPKVARGALAYARSRGATRIFCGHTHQTNTLISQGVSYYNAGSWTNGQPSYITVLGKEVAIHVYLGRTDNCYSGEERREASPEASDVAGEAGLPAYVEYEGVFG